MILKPVSEQFIKTKEFKQLDLNDLSKSSVEGISTSSFPLIISSIFNKTSDQLLVITENTTKMQEVYLDLTCLVNPDILYNLPPWETLPYEFVSPSVKIERERITSLYKMLGDGPYIIITTVESLIRKLPEKERFIKKGIELEINEDYPFDDIIEMLVSYGYSREARVEGFGHFSVKGGIIDIFLPTHDNPLRLDFFGDTLESIREFHLDSQISFEKHASVTIYPERELLLFKNERDELLKIFKNYSDNGFELSDEIIKLLYNSENENFDSEMAGSSISGIEDLFPLILNSSSIISYLSENTKIIYLEVPELISRKNQLNKIFTELYEKRKSKTVTVEPEKLIDTEMFEKAGEKALKLQTFITSRDSMDWSLKSIPNFRGKIKHVREEIAQRIEDGWKIIVTTGFEGQARRLFDLLGEFSPHNNFEEVDINADLNILITPQKEGVEINPCKIFLLTDHEIFGKSYRKSKRFKKKKSRPIESFLDLNAGDYIVHINHGIGIFKGITRMAAGGVERDFLYINYANEDKLYVSLDQITQVQKYIGIENRKPRIDSLGKKSAWNRIKKKAQESVEEIAKELMEIYSKRSSLKGFQYPPDTLWQEEFESLFEYEETPDQISAIEDVKDDMESNKPMDRLVCGDVGFGKTEIAIRAAFKAVMAGRQVAILVPTTLLAMQHYATFNKRFADYPINVDMISRFKTHSQIISIREELAKGSIDILIGTHALLSNDTKFKTLGLIVIDEEQKFGVKHKEKLKRFRTMVDVLTLSATPIPRTLHMSMAGIRDLSTIITPPDKRQAIDTYVLEENPDIIKAAIQNEIRRNGQIYFIHNRVGTIEAIAEMLKKLVPEANFCIAHGQMDEHELEEIMINFLNREYDVLISTTIIESGIDIPNVNTIFINRADTFGLSQLYQLKGRVGRSIVKAYAYLFYPKHAPLTEDARKRLQVISEYSELGSGFKIAMKDLEIRGAGNILGKEQSGSIMEVGFDLYCQMLDNAIKSLKGEKLPNQYRTPVFINTDIYIPDSYINDERQKIEFYKKFVSCETIEEVDLLKDEMIDRFGQPPDKVKILVELESIRAVASSLLIDEILEDSKSIRVKISGQSTIDPGKIVKQITDDERISIEPGDTEKLIFKPRSKKIEKKLDELKKWLQQL